MSIIEQISALSEFSRFTSMRIKLILLTSTINAIVFEISQIAQVTRAIYAKDMTRPFKLLNKAIKYVYDHKESIRIPKHD